MSISVKAVLRTDKARADGTAPVHLNIIANRKRSRKSTGIYVLPSQWNETRQKVRAGCDLSEAYNAKIASLLNEARTAALGASTAQAVTAALGRTPGSLSDYFEQHVERLRGAGKHWQTKHFAVTLNHLRAALGQNVQWGEVDRGALERFERFLRVERGNQPNTVRNHLKRLRRVYKAALRDGIVTPGDDPFLTFDPPRAAAVHRRKLTVAQIQTLADAPVEAGSTEAIAQDAFLFSFYAAGVRFADLASLQTANLKENLLEYRMMKTGATVAVTLPAPAVEIADRYAATADQRDGFLFPFLRARDARNGVVLRTVANRANSRMNGALKRVAAAAGMEADGLSFHIARHSYADLARRKGGNLHDVSRALGHTSLTTTEAYLGSLDLDAADRLAEVMWESGKPVE